ncbi:hypothetical protein ACFQH6_20510 [Halobacteriaceae archaeon GCM10025711]
MPVDRWKTIKGIFYALLITGLAVYSVYSDADPTAVFLSATIAMLVVFGVELREVELVRGITLTFGTQKHRPPDDQEDD